MEMFTIVKYIIFSQIKLQSHSNHKIIFMKLHKLVLKFNFLKICESSPKIIDKKSK